MPILSRGRGGVITAPPPSRGGEAVIVLGRPRVGGGGSGDLLSLSEQGEPELGGDITFSAGTGITLTQVGNDIEIAVS